MSMMSNDYAVYLPAVNANYARTIVADLPPDRSLPSGLSLEDFAFWQSDSSLWNHPYCLHSIGQYSVGSNTSNAMTHRRNEPSSSCDSGRRNHLNPDNREYHCWYTN